MYKSDCVGSNYLTGHWHNFFAQVNKHAPFLHGVQVFTLLKQATAVFDILA